MERINEKKASDYLEIQYVEIKEEIHKLSAHKNFAGVFQAIVNHINLLLSTGQIEKIGLKLKLIGWLYRRGNEYVRYIIENLFVRSFEGMKKRCTAEQWIYMYQSIPKNLKNVYQLQNTNCLIQKISL
ncbi:hypothetical protein KO02_22140 [Sphingobacterium sp. ML3W]|uniref:DUF7674 family protein n=1 Tax=Sphingobacterium sp. ML3W TaxID=1538644 RepID=UPI0004F60D03|nr:hypothetical protein [Sphingobacterium sp. ML3W]AIM39084.1 hypothetical protein KO02_22140 [Sphingobacterium sp. ML3W]